MLWGDAGFIELRGASPVPVDISGWKVRSCSQAAVATIAVVPDGTTLADGEFYVVTGQAFSGSVGRQLVVADVPSTGTALLRTNGTKADGVDSNPASPCHSGKPAPSCPNGSTARDAASHDTKDNATDFTCRLPSPGEPNT